jgi:hypothetical protein
MLLPVHNSVKRAAVRQAIAVRGFGMFLWGDSLFRIVPFSMSCADCLRRFIVAEVSVHRVWKTMNCRSPWRSAPSAKPWVADDPQL